MGSNTIQNFFFSLLLLGPSIMCYCFDLKKKKKGLFVFCNWCDVPLLGLTYLVAEAKVGEMSKLVS